MIRLRLLGPTDLSGSQGPRGQQLLAQPKRLALLVYLADARPLADRAGSPRGGRGRRWRTGLGRLSGSGQRQAV